MITTITGKHQVTIPATIAQKLNLYPGQRLDWQIELDGQLIIKILPSKGEMARDAAGMGHEWLAEGVDPISELVDERIKDDEDEGLA